MPQQAAFTLKCVGCGIVEIRPASKCQEQPYCTKCYCPMVLQKAEVRNL